MNVSVIVQDFIVYMALLAAIAVYRASIRRRLPEPDAERIGKRFAWIASILATLLMVLGALHQVGVLLGIAAYILFGATVIISLISLVLLRRQMR